MKSHEVLRQVFQKSGPKNVAQALRFSPGHIHKWMRPRGDAGTGAPNPLDRVAQVVALTGDRRPVEWLCRQAGGYFVPNPKNGNHRPKDLVEEENRLMSDVGEMIGLLGRTARKKAVTLREAADLRTEWERLKSLTEYFVVCCEQGAF